MAAGTIADFRRLFDNEPNAAARAVGGAAMAMVRAWHDPRWGGFTCRIAYVDYFARASAFASLVRDALKEARDAGQMSFQIGRAACRVRLCTYGLVTVGPGALKKTIN